MAGVIVGGWDPTDGAGVYVLPLGGTLMKLPFAVGGSGSTYIYGYIDSEYKPGMTRDECQQFVRKAISHAMARDGSSGGIIRLVTVDSNGTDREYIDKLPFVLE